MPELSKTGLVLLALCFLSSGGCRQDSGETTKVNISGTIDSTLVLLDGFNYTVEFPGLIVSGSGRLIIEPGVTVEFQREGDLRFGLVVFGVLEASGTENKPIRFRPQADNPDPFDWIGITLSEPSGPCVLSFCEVSFAIDGIKVLDASVSSPVEIRNCTVSKSGFSESTGRGVFARNSSDVSVLNSEMRDNRVGVSFDQSNGVISENLVVNSLDRGIETDHSVVQIDGNRVVSERSDSSFVYGIYSDFSEINVINNTIQDANKLVFIVGFNPGSVNFNNIIVTPLTGMDSGLRYIGVGQDTLNATMNYWGTTDEDLIRSKFEGAPTTIRFRPISTDSLVN